MIWKFYQYKNYTDFPQLTTHADPHSYVSSCKVLAYHTVLPQIQELMQNRIGTIVLSKISVKEDYDCIFSARNRDIYFGQLHQLIPPDPTEPDFKRLLIDLTRIA